MTPHSDAKSRISLAPTHVAILLGALVALLVAWFMVVREAPPAFDTTLKPGTTGAPTSNPLTGQYLWFPQDHPEGVPNGLPARDSYARFSWKDLEPAEAAYDFSLIDRELDAAKERGGRFSFRVMAACTNCSEDVLPPDLSRAATSWTAQSPTGPVRVPDWNDPAFLERWMRLMTALGARYDNHPRLAYVDVGGYGNWGEGHNWPYSDRYPGPQGQKQASIDSLRTIIRAATGSFQRTFVVLNPPQIYESEQQVHHGKSWELLGQSLRESPRLGLRNDCLGGAKVQAATSDFLMAAQEISERKRVPLLDQPLQRWRVAPFVSEWCDNIRPDGDGGSFVQGEQQVRQWHITQVSNGNFTGRIESYPREQRAAFLTAQSHAGFDLSVKNAHLTRPRGEPMRISAVWQNSGSAPPYDRWNVTYRLVESGSVVHSIGESSVDLRTMLGDDDTTTDEVAFPGTEGLSGTYQLEVLVSATYGDLPPMELASGSKTPAGAYTLGEVRIP